MAARLTAGRPPEATSSGAPIVFTVKDAGIVDQDVDARLPPQHIDGDPISFVGKHRVDVNSCDRSTRSSCAVSFRAVVTEVSAPASVSWIKIASKMNRIIFAIILQALALGGVAQAPEPPTPEQQLLTLLNLERRQAHLTVFQSDAKVAEAAQAHSQMLANRRMLSHQFAGEPELMRRVSSTGARFSSVAENVAVAADAEEPHLALMMAPGRRANIFNPDYNAVVIAVARANNQIYVTEHFAHVVAAYSAE